MEIKYYPESLGVHEKVIFSEKKLFATYYITTERLIIETKFGKTREIPLKNIKEISAQQNEIEKALDIGRISFMHSNYEKNVPLTRRKYVTFKFIKNPEETYACLQQKLQLQ